MAEEQQSKSEDLSLETLPDEDRGRVLQLTRDISINDSQSIIQYGVGAQTSIAEFADSILEQIKVHETGYVGEIMTDLMLRVKSLKVDKLSTTESFLSKIPIISAISDSVKRFVAQYNKVSTEIDSIVDELTKARLQLLRDITLLDEMYLRNNEYISDLDLYIIAGQLKLKEIEESVIQELRKAAESSRDAIDAQKVQDMTQLAARFDKKLHDLRLSRMVALQTAPQLRLIQSNDQVLVEKIQSSILNTIPLWKNQVVIAISLFRQKKALDLQKEVSATTNELLEKNAEMLRQSSVEVARESEKGIVSIDTLKKVHQDLLATIEETLQIQEEGQVKRRQAEVELVKLEHELREKLVQVKSTGPDSLAQE